MGRDSLIIALSGVAATIVSNMIATVAGWFGINTLADAAQWATIVAGTFTAAGWCINIYTRLRHYRSKKNGDVSQSP